METRYGVKLSQLSDEAGGGIYIAVSVENKKSATIFTFQTKLE
ncbi:MAG: hypothetical protein ACK456_01670 [Pseudanabaenaceae cyanobacterium]